MKHILSLQDFLLKESLVLEYSNNLILNLKKKFLEENPTLTDDQMDYYINTFDKHKDRFDIKDRDILKYTFSKLEHFIDQKIPRNKSSKAVNDDEITPLYENDNVKIYLADTKLKSIILGKGTSWCISRRDSSNMYNTYRDRENKTIYFVYTLTKKYVVLVDESNKYYLADESNSGDFTGSEIFTFPQIIKIVPELEGCKKYFKHIEGDKSFSQKINFIDFENLTYDDKDKYISYGHELTDAQYYILDNELKSKYINLGHKLTDADYVETIPKLQKRYFDIQISSDLSVRLSEIQLSDITDNKDLLSKYSKKLIMTLLSRRSNLNDYELTLIPFEYLKHYFLSNYRYLNDTEKEFYKENTDRIRKEISGKPELSLNEFIQDDEVQLYKMFQMTWDEKYLECSFLYDYLLEDFLAIWRTNDSDEQEIIEEDIESNNKLEKLDMIGSNIRKKFGRWVFDNIHKLDIDQIPSWVYFSEPQIIKNQWLIHLSDYSSYIEKEGFTHGVDDIMELGLTTYIPHVAKKRGGFNFAYTISDFDKYGKGWGRHGKHNFKYGSEAVIFKASGVRVWHSGDGEYQAIFLGKKAKNIVYLRYDDSDKKWFIRSKITDNVLVKKEKISEISLWLDQNYAQYHHHL